MHSGNLQEGMIQTNKDEGYATTPSSINSAFGFNEKTWVLSLISAGRCFVFVIEGLKPGATMFLENFTGEYSADINHSSLPVLLKMQTQISGVKIKETCGRINSENYFGFLSNSYQIDAEQANTVILSIKEDQRLCSEEKYPRCSFLEKNYFPELISNAQLYGWYAEKLKIATQSQPEKKSACIIS